jgi:GNAT superfamily N-acetyltransferase
MSVGSTLIVRPVRPEDAAQLCENCFSANTLGEVEARIASALSAREQGTMVLFVAEAASAAAASSSKRTIVGTGSLIRAAHPLHAHRGELSSLVVHPDYQRQGIARRIVDAICDQAAVWGIAILEVGCRGGTPAETAYRRLGFVECGRLPGGIAEPGPGGRIYDEISFYMPVAKEGGGAR